MSCLGLKGNNRIRTSLEPTKPALLVEPPEEEISRAARDRVDCQEIVDPDYDELIRNE
tara:strand:+ start:214 stop:387 length:174 start_codon:yes stop_codon:yes gene_type:complete